MPSPILAETIALELGGQEPWPNDVKLYQPYEVEQILLPDNANCLAVQAYLRMCGLPYQVEQRPNAEFMSPSGNVPFIKCGKYVVPELEPIVTFVEHKGISLTSNLDDSQKSDMKAYMSLVNFVLGNSEYTTTSFHFCKTLTVGEHWIETKKAQCLNLEQKLTHKNKSDIDGGRSI